MDLFHFFSVRRDIRVGTQCDGVSRPMQAIAFITCKILVRWGIPLWKITKKSPTNVFTNHWGFLFLDVKG